MEIVFIAHYAGSPKHGMVYGHYHLAKEWVELGHNVTIVAASYAHTRFNQPEIKQRISEEFIDGIRYLWIHTRSYRGNISRVVSIFSFVAQCFFNRLPINKADLVICSSHHPFAIYPAKKLAQKSGAKLVFEVRDLWPLTLIELGGAKPNHPFIRLMQNAEDHAYRIAYKVVSVLPFAKEYMVEHGMNPDKFLFVPNGVDLAEINKEELLPAAHQKRLEELKSAGKFLIGYAGKIGLSNVLHPFIEGVAKSSDGNVHAVILGDGALLPELRKLANDLNIEERVTFLEPVSRTQILHFLSFMDAAYVGYQKQPLYRFGISPTKINDYMLAALPIIYAVEAPGDVVAESGAGISCHAEDGNAICDAISVLRDLSQEELKAMGLKGREWLIANRDYKMLAKRFLDNVTSPTGVAV